MGDLDITLIREFASRPGFYDRNNAYYKDKEFAEQAWDEISNNLGYDVPLLKDRMLQLRNRYNLEKRRLENLAAENPTKAIRSPWPLYQHLNFLSNHIRTRRSYKTMMARTSTGHTPQHHHHHDLSMMLSMAGGQPAASSMDTDHQYAYSNNGQIDVKNEMSGNESDSQTFGHPNMGNDDFSDPSAYLADNGTSDNEMPPTNGDGPSSQHNLSNPSTSSAAPPEMSRIAVRNLDSLKRTSLNMFPAAPMPLPMLGRKRPRFEGRADKYDAFGRFLATSLCDMPERKALVLIKKFTADLIGAMMSSAGGGGDGDEADEGDEKPSSGNGQEEQDDDDVQEVA